MSFQLWELVDGEGIWQKYKNTQTGELSVKTYTPRAVATGCDNHYFIEEGSSRSVVCNKCGFGRRYILGKEKLKDGKLVPIKE